MNPTWVSATATVIGMVCMVLLAVDRWVHRQDSNAERFVEKMALFQAEQIRQGMMIQAANERSSKERSAHQAKLNRLELRVALVEQRSGMRPKHDDEG